MQSNSSVVLITVGALVVAGAAYWYFFTGTGNQAPLTADVEQTAAQSQVKSLVSQLQSIKFDTTIFEDPSFIALVDLRTPVTHEAAGRPDPFAPIPGLLLK
jgi:hypothetical protein